MSSTKRSGLRKQHAHDYYVTPLNKINEFLDAFIEVEGNIFKDANILDPSSGGDPTHAMSYPEALITHLGVAKENIYTIDIREDSLAAEKGDYLEMDCKNKYDVIITNPPFNISSEFVLKALDEVKEGGYCIFLLRLNYFGSKKRKFLWDVVMPKYSFVHSQRVSFTDDRRADSIEYQHMVFKKDYTDKYTALFII